MACRFIEIGTFEVLYGDAYSFIHSFIHYSSGVDFFVYIYS